jgi:hypothetical protein
MERNSVEFTHFITGKKVVIVDKSTVAAFFHGDCKHMSITNAVSCVWLSVDKVRDPIPVTETEDEVRFKLGLTEIGA